MRSNQYLLEIPVQLTNELHGLIDRVVRLYILDLPEGLVIIDTGMTGNINRIERYVSKLGRKLEDIKHIIITHSDSDHYGSLYALQSKTRAKTYASQTEAVAIRKGEASRALKLKGLSKLMFGILSRVFRAHPANVDVILKPGKSLPYWGGLEVLDTQGHTPGHISLYSKKHSTLFAGDSILIHSGKLVPAHGGNTWDEARAKKAFDFQVKLAPKILCGGHGWKVNS